MKFLFDLDGTVTEAETLPHIAGKFGLEAQILPLTAAAIAGHVPFAENFQQRVRLLSHLGTSAVANVVNSIPLNAVLVDFIRQNSSDCAIVTGNYRGWIEQLVAPLNCPVFASEGRENSAGQLEITSVLNKADIVKKFKNQGEFVVFIGDGHNDAGAMAQADIAIGAGIVHEPAPSVHSACDFLAYNSQSLVRSLNQIKCQTAGTTAIITAAGTGSRLDLGVPKPLLRFTDRSLISWQLGWLENIEDIRVVVGYQSSEVIAEVTRTRPDVTFVYNHEFGTTNVGRSAFLGSRFSRDMTLIWDGDLIVHPEDLARCMDFTSEYLGVSSLGTEDGWFVELSDDQQVTGFIRTASQFEWSGPAFLRSNRILDHDGHLFQMLQPSLPLPARVIRALDIDTYDDFVRATEFMREHYDASH